MIYNMVAPLERWKKFVQQAVFCPLSRDIKWPLNQHDMCMTDDLQTYNQLIYLQNKTHCHY